MENLSEAKRRLLEQRLRGARPGAQTQNMIVVRPAGTPPHLSFAQERLWFLNELHPGSSAYNMHEAVLLEGATRSGCAPGEPECGCPPPGKPAHPV
jgi:hypothetical protein